MPRCLHKVVKVFRIVLYKGRDRQGQVVTEPRSFMASVEDKSSEETEQGAQRDVGKPRDH